MPVTNQRQTVQTLQAAFSANKLDKAQVIEAAKTQGITLPTDFFDVRSDAIAPQQFAPADGAASTGAGRVAELRMQSAQPKRALPNPAPELVRVGKMNLKKLAQTPDMILYVNYIKGRPTLVYVMAKLDPSTALSLNSGFAKDRKALVLADRDGVIKDSRFLNTPDKQGAADVMIPSALAAAKKLDDAGVGLAIVTNQGGYEIGKMSFEDTIAINVRVSQQIANAGGHLDAIFICPFSSALKDAPEGVVDARKPSHGMTTYAKQLAEKKGIQVLGMVGDQRTDGAAGQGAGLKFHAVTDGNGRWVAEKADAERKNETLPTLQPFVEHASFADAVDVLLAG
jgi:D-glycero-D-manno-heptose 1,7-bisphosphate phosphatase